MSEPYTGDSKVAATFHGARFVPAAAVKKGDEVILPAATAHYNECSPIVVTHIANSTPVGGSIQWTDENGVIFTVSASQRVEVVNLV